MVRVEIIANRSVEENILDAIKFENAGKHYTKYPNILGVGNSGPHMGDAIWPEENFIFVIWCEEEEVQAIERAVAYVKAKFPNEGIKMFSLPGGQVHAQIEEGSVESQKGE
ncbi:MAG: hypothetical protein FWB78_08530 [Treponema sp.]|nr:hypothetical protein [Treponema sp.]